MAKNDSQAASSMHNVLAMGTTIKGDIHAEEDFRIDGNIVGNIFCKGRIIIGQQSLIAGNIDGINIDMMGAIEGNITRTDIVILRSTAKLTGNISTKSIEIEPGAIFSGNCSMIE